jgi:hypothetical protein
MVITSENFPFDVIETRPKVFAGGVRRPVGFIFAMPGNCWKPLIQSAEHATP